MRINIRSLIDGMRLERVRYEYAGTYAYKLCVVNWSRGILFARFDSTENYGVLVTNEKAKQIIADLPESSTSEGYKTTFIHRSLETSSNKLEAVRSP